MTTIVTHMSDCGSSSDGCDEYDNPVIGTFSKLLLRRHTTDGNDIDTEHISEEIISSFVMIPRSHIDIYRYGFNKKEFRYVVCHYTMAVAFITIIAVSLGISYQIFIRATNEQIVLIIMNKLLNQ